MSSTFLKAVATRRTHYALKPTLPEGVTIDTVQSTIQDIVKHTPTSFNSQSTRAIIITGDLFQTVWKSVLEAIPAEYGKKRIQSIIDEAAGSVIFFHDEATIKQFQQNIPALSDFFPTWAANADGAAHIISWAALQELGLGAHLQHYNGFVKAALGDKVPESWSVQAQLVFGTIAAPANDKTFIENEVKVLDK